MSMTPRTDAILNAPDKATAVEMVVAAIRADAEFDAVQMILVLNGKAQASNAAFAAWALGPIQGQHVISDFLDQHGLSE